MIIRDHINLTGANPLAGPNEESWGIRFPDMNHIYTPELAELAQAGAQQAGIAVHTGVYAGLKGPSLRITSYNVCYTKLLRASRRMAGSGCRNANAFTGNPGCSQERKWIWRVLEKQAVKGG